MSRIKIVFVITSVLYFASCSSSRQVTTTNEQNVHPDLVKKEGILLNKKVDGFHGIWYMNQPLDNEYKFKYSGGMGTYCAKHNPFAIYRQEVDKTFFCYGGTNEDNSTLYHMVSYFDHKTGKVAKPTLVLDKQTIDAHDNPILSMDRQGYIYLFSTSHGRSRPSYVHRSAKPYDINKFVPVDATKIEDGKTVPMDNFSYMQTWYVPDQGYVSFFTKYNYPADRTICFMTSKDGKEWSAWNRIAAIQKGHYQISAVQHGTAASAFNYHPDTETKNGLNWRTNLYYVQTKDFGKSWQSVDGQKLDLPLTEVKNPALIHDYDSENLNVYLKDITFDPDGNPVVLYITSKGFEAGPKNDPRTWRIAHWKNGQWQINDITTSNNNYDTGSLFIERDGSWRLIAPTADGPQSYNPGGEIVMWISHDEGKTWTKVKQMTQGSPYNHNYARRPVQANPQFYSLWADGNGRQISPSSIYFCNQQGDVFRLPTKMNTKMMKPEKVN
ncbi:MAG: BNR-4 repeat-containing protein [Saprospiraceae bacterium]|nr:BNR-4 repeat-containing protein [Saprospiraceae bacterium]